MASQFDLQSLTPLSIVGQGALPKLIKEERIGVLERGEAYAEGFAEGKALAVLPWLGHQILNLNLLLYIIPLC